MCLIGVHHNLSRGRRGRLTCAQIERLSAVHSAFAERGETSVARASARGMPSSSESAHTFAPAAAAASGSSSAASGHFSSVDMASPGQVLRIDGNPNVRLRTASVPRRAGMRPHELPVPTRSPSARRPLGGDEFESIASGRTDDCKEENAVEPSLKRRPSPR